MNTWIREAVGIGAAGEVGFAGVYVAILLLGRFVDSLPGLGFLVEALLYSLLIAALGAGATLPARQLGVEWQIAALGSLGSHVLWLMVVYAASSYVEIPSPNAMVLTLAAGFGVLLLLSDRPEVETRSLALLGAAVLALALVIWADRLPGYAVAALAWTVFPAFGAVIIRYSEIGYRT